MKITPKKHPDYDEHYFTWKRVEDCYDGQDKLLRNVHLYFPCPVGLHSEELKQTGQYDKSVEFIKNRIAVGSSYGTAAKAYYSNAIFPSLVSYTVNGFMSLITEHDPIVQLPDRMSYFFESTIEDDVTERSFNKQLQKQIYVGVLKTGRVPVLIDPDASGKPNFVVYPATSVLNWVTSNDQENKGQLLEALIEENIANDEYSVLLNNKNRTKKKYIHLIIENGVYKSYIYTEKENDDYDVEEKIPSVQGKTLNYIPLLFIGSEDNTADVDVAPLSGIAVNQVKYGQLESLLSHAENQSGAPTFIISGVDSDNMPKVTGAGVGIALPDAMSKAYYTTTDTSFMTSIRERQSECLSQAQDQGANLLGSSKNTSESGEALRLRQAASTATLKSIIGNIGQGIEQLLMMCADWLGADKNEVSYTPNQEFSTFALTANEQIAMVQSWQAGAISHSTLLENFRKAGMLKPGETVENEKDTLKQDGEKYVNSDDKGTSSNPLDVGEDLQKPNNLDKRIQGSYE